MHRDDRAQPPGRLGQHQVAGSVPDRVVDRGEAVQIEEDNADPAGRRGIPQRVPGPLLDVGTVRQAGQPVVEGQVGDLLAQRHLVADVAGGDQHLAWRAGYLVAQHGRLDVPPGPVGGPHPGREAAGAARGVRGTGRVRRIRRFRGGLRAQREPRRGQHGRPVLGMDEVGQLAAVQVGRAVAVVADRRAGVTDDPVQVADQHHVAGPAGQVAQALAGFPPDRQQQPVLIDQHEDPDSQDQDARAARHDQRRSGRRGPGQAVADHDHGGDDRGQRGDDGGGGRTRGPAGPPHLGDRPRGQAEQDGGQHGHQLGGDARVPAEGPLPDGQRIPDRNGQQGQVGQQDPPPGRGDQGKQGAQDGQVGQHLDQGKQEGARPVTGPVELRAEQGDPADHQQGDRHDVAVGQPGQHRAGRGVGALEHLGPARPRDALAFGLGREPLGAGEHHDAHSRGGYRQQRRQAGQRQPGDRARRRFRHLLDDQAGAVQSGRSGQPPVAPGEGAVMPARAEPQAHRRREPRQHAKHAHPRHPEMITRTWAPSMSALPFLKTSTHARHDR